MLESLLVAVVWIGVFLIGPPALLFWLVRRRRRRTRAAQPAADVASASAQVPAAAPAAPAAPETPATSSEPEPASDSYRFPYGLPLVIYPLLAIAQNAVRGNAWGSAVVMLVCAGFAIGFARLAFDSADFESARSNDPSLNLPTWRINWLLFFSAPAAVLAVLGAAILLRG